MVSIFSKCIIPWLCATAEKVWNETIGEDSWSWVKHHAWRGACCCDNRQYIERMCCVQHKQFWNWVGLSKLLYIWYPVLDPNYLFFIPYRRLDCLNIVPFSSQCTYAYTHIYTCMHLPVYIHWFIFFILFGV